MVGFWLDPCTQPPAGGSGNKNWVSLVFMGESFPFPLCLNYRTQDHFCNKYFFNPKGVGTFR